MVAGGSELNPTRTSTTSDTTLNFRSAQDKPKAEDSKKSAA
jgi:hypothetical protein